MKEQNIYTTVNIAIILILWIWVLLFIHALMELKWWGYLLVGPVSFVIVFYLGQRTVTRVTNPIIGWIISRGSCPKH